MTHFLFDRALIARRTRHALADGGEGAYFLIACAAEDLAARLALVRRRFDVALDLGTPTRAFTEVLRGSGQVARVVRAGLADADVVADEETLPFAHANLDLVVSGLTLHFANDLPGVLVQLRRALKPDGLFLAAVLGGETLTELREAFARAEAEVEGGASPRVAPFADVRELGGLLRRAGFALPVTDVERVTARYADAFGLMKDLRAMGATNALLERRRRPLRRETLLRMAAVYAERFAGADGRVPATFDIVWLSGWAPHESQQKPLKPGSAKARLADALRTTEWTASGKPR